MEKSSWLEDEQYILLCVAVACKRLHISDVAERNFLLEMAHHSDSDGSFFNKVRLIYNLKPTVEVTKDEEAKQPAKIIITMGEYNNGEKTKLPPILEARLRELRSND